MPAAHAQSAAQSTLDSGDTAWILVASALVLLMTLPGLALFYGELVRSINVLSVMMQCCAVACVSSVLWMVVGYSIAFGDGGSANAWFGGFDKAFLIGIGVDSLSGTIPEALFCLFQMTFAVITPALSTGGLAIGFAGGVICYLAVDLIKSKFGIDDTLDIFAVHGVGGLLGTLLTAVFGATAFGGLGLEAGIAKQLGIQFTGLVVTVLWTALASWLIVLVVRKLVGLRIDAAGESEGLDYTTHGEHSYHL